MDRNIVFISYPHEDAIIAERLMSAVLAMPGNKFETFLDRSYIKGGQNISYTIKEALKRTVYLVAIGTDVTRRNFDWCGQELGYYQGSHPDGDRRETSLYQASIPEIFSETRCFRAQSLLPSQREEFGDPVVPAAESDFHEFLIDLADLHAQRHSPTNHDTWAKVPGWAEYWTMELASAFFDAAQNREKDTWYPQGRIALSITDGDFYRRADPLIPESTDVLLSGSLYNMLGQSVPESNKARSWSTFARLVIDASGSDTLCRIVNDVVISALPSRAEAKNDYVFQAPNQRFYRVLLVRHTVFGNRRRDFVLNVVETLDRVRGGDRATTVLVAGIVLGSRYRSIFLEVGATYGPEVLATLADDALKDRLAALLRDIDLINADAASDGVADFAALEEALGSKGDVKALFARWWVVFPAMERDAKRFVASQSPEDRQAFFASYAAFIEASRKNNAVFLRLCLDRYRSYIK